MGISHNYTWRNGGSNQGNRVSQENVFKPLSMKASFYRTPDIQARLVDLAYRRDGKLEAWANQSTLIEQDADKGE